jgi:diguanylate cyclase (GGDEF)-like protein/PAS domain S-box-containing protein
MTDPNGKQPSNPSLPASDEDLLPAIAEISIRQQAEDIARCKVEQSPGQFITKSPEQLVHELHVHQIELKLQNQELHRAQLELCAEKERYLELYNFAPVAFLSVSDKGLIIQANLAAANLLGLPQRELVNKRLSSFIVREYQDSYYLYCNQVFETNDPKTFKLKMLNHNGAQCWASMQAVAIPDVGGLPTLNIALNNVNELITAEIKLLESESRLQEAMNHACIAGWELAKGKDTAVWSNQICKLMGLLEDFQPGPDKPYQLIHADDRQAVTDSLEHSFATGADHQIEYRIQRHDNGEERWIECRGKAVLNNHGVPEKLTGFIQDITERKQAELQQRIAATAFEVQEGIIITDAGRNILRVNSAFTKITGYPAEEVIGKNTRILKSGRHDADFYEDMWKSINITGAWDGEIWNRRKNGDSYLEHLLISTVKDITGVITNFVGTLTDITMSSEAADKIKHLAFYDPLTDLPNRLLLRDRLMSALASSQRNDQYGALLFIDLDNFKMLNDTLGHDMGDLLLRQLAERLKECVRESDTIARFGGDEFVVMLEDLGGSTNEALVQIEVVGNKILTTFRQPYQLAAHNYQSTASLGVTMFKGQEKPIDELLKHADIAMYQAKSAGRNTLCFFDPQMQTRITNRMELERDMKLALAENQFTVHYQPQVQYNQKIIGAEALIRWHHPKRGMISPIEFIPLAEESGMILPIGQWVLETACAQLKNWESNEHTRHLQIAINISARQFHQANFVAQVSHILNRTAINPCNLKLELTESLVLDDIDNTILKMHSLREIGIRFSMDDFGTGYSSLSSLRKLPLYQLKIDQSFVRDITTDPDDAVIVQTIIAMAMSLGMEVIAEGVETEEQRAFLELHGCHAIQGYLFGRPMPLDEFEKLLAST